MLAKKYRLPIQTVLRQKARVFRDPYLTFKIFSNPLPYARIGVIVSSKIASKATARNRIRRAIFSCFDLEFLFNNAGKDILVIAAPKTAALAVVELKSIMRGLCSKLF